MSNKRTNLLILILLILLGFYFYQVSIQSRDGVQDQPPLQGRTEILSVEMKKKDTDSHYAVIDYFYTGEPSPAYVSAFAVAERTDFSNPYSLFSSGNYIKLERGRNTIELGLANPRLEFGITNSRIRNINLHLTKYVEINLFSNNSKGAIQRLNKDYVVEWKHPFDIAEELRLEDSTIAELYKETVALIDRGSQFDITTAKKNIETIILRDPSYVPAYVEMARVEMRTSWSEDGLRKAESHLTAALDIDIDHANAHVLLGYVYSNQQKYTDAQSEFEIAEKLGTNNLWLWANWGQLFIFQGEIKEAIEKYMKAANAQRPFDTYDRAQLDAYTKLIALLRVEKEVKEVGRLMLKRMIEYKNFPCLASEYAMYLVKFEGDVTKSEEIAKQAISQGCQYKVAQRAIGVANYFKWYSADQYKKIESLSQAKVFYPESPELYNELITSTGGKEILRELLKKEKMNVDVKNSENHTALSLMLFEEDERAVRSLLSLKANPNLTIGNEGFPISFIPIVSNNVATLDLMKEFGVDYRKIVYANLTAREFSDQIGSTETSKVLPVGSGI